MNELVEEVFFPDGKLHWMSGLIACRLVDDQWIAIVPLSFGRARVQPADPTSLLEPFY